MDDWRHGATDRLYLLLYLLRLRAAGFLVPRQSRQSYDSDGSAAGRHGVRLNRGEICVVGTSVDGPPT